MVICGLMDVFRVISGHPAMSGPCPCTPNSGHRQAGTPSPLSAKPGSERVTKNTLTNGHRQAAEHVRLVPLAEAMLMAEFVCIRRALSAARARLETGPA